MLVPLHGFFQGDTLGIIVLVHDDETVATIAAKLRQAVSMRVARSSRDEVRFRGERLDSTLTVRAAGLTALDRVDVVPATEVD